jgi:hypothetical protein
VHEPFMRGSQAGVFPTGSDPATPLGFELREVARDERVDEGVGAPLVEDEIGAQVPFPLEADFFKNALRSNVARFNERFDARKPCVGHCPSSDKGNRTRA